MNYKPLFSDFIGQLGDHLHFAAHSHHLWPNVAKVGQLRYWQLAEKMRDRKWDEIFGNEIPKAQKHISSILNWPYHEQIAFAPNTHEFVVRLLSSLNWQQLKKGKKLKVLTTDSEFHSFTRQILRMEEEKVLDVTRISTEPFETFETRFLEAAKKQYDLVFFSQVFFNSGYVVQNLKKIVDSVNAPETLIVIDGYHGFMAIPTDLALLSNRVFYLSGGYKYAMSGEGVCFLCIPKGCSHRPINTGWFAGFGSLSEGPEEKVSYSNDAFRYWGSTFDPSGVYRFNAVMEEIDKEKITVEMIHQYVKGLQSQFLSELLKYQPKKLPFQTIIPALPKDSSKTASGEIIDFNLVQLEKSYRGHFITFDLEHAEEVEKRLSELKVEIDRRGRRLRFGFGIYQDNNDISNLMERLKQL
ncbi:MAG: aminotransferase class V-fold PLP-dependent enzyme [Chloroherpetonaceae bacterium]|nr:aminotransferase class V-fold PLP-dependent enzyme [Chloroherpetonaceae bacterium]